jgi:hypothetical protein
MVRSVSDSAAESETPRFDSFDFDESHCHGRRCGALTRSIVSIEY